MIDESNDARRPRAARPSRAREAAALIHAQRSAARREARHWRWHRATVGGIGAVASFGLFPRALLVG